MVSQAYSSGTAAELLAPPYARRAHAVPTAAAAMHHYRRGAASPVAALTAAGRLSAAPALSTADEAPQPAQRSPLLCGYPSKKCWSWRVEKRNGELHKFCEYHRQKANTNQRRMEQRRKLGQGKPRAARTAAASAAISHSSANANASASASASAGSSSKTCTVAAAAAAAAYNGKCRSQSAALKVEPVKTEPSKTAAASASPRGVDVFEASAPAPDAATAAYSWMDVELDVGLDAAVEYMLFDPAVIDMEPSDKPVELFEEDLFFLEHFIDEIAHSPV